jgi:hypothetical protein
MTNRFAGNTRIGADTAPTVALDVTGAALVSSTLGVTGAVTLTNKVTTYNNVATASDGIPYTIASVDATAQAAAVSATTLYTPPANGFYRLSMVLQVTQAATVSSQLGGVTIAYTDGDGSVAQSDAMALFNASAAIAASGTGNTTNVKLNGTKVLYAKSGVAITYAIAYTSVGATAMQYAYHIKLEKL